MAVEKVIFSLEDDEDIAKIINVSLTKAGYRVFTFFNAADFFKGFNTCKPDLILLDLMLPDIQGLDVLKQIRAEEKNRDIQIIIISAKRMVMDKVEGLDLGADDYIEKPFDILELISRVNARLRRSAEEKDIYTCRGLTLSEKSHSCSFNGEVVELTNSEFAILALLMKKCGEVVSREETDRFLYQGEKGEVESRSIDVHVASLRKKLAAAGFEGIRTVYGFGYKLD
jgi:two-component system alkaline phosphatase synthesis response regulator PhoP